MRWRGVLGACATSAACLLAAACGQKGPLTLPAASPAASAPAR
jgi:predicted small lipoprotein YifL